MNFILQWQLGPAQQLVYILHPGSSRVHKGITWKQNVLPIVPEYHKISILFGKSQEISNNIKYA